MSIYSSCRKFLRIIRTQAYTHFIISGPVNPPVVDSVYNNKKRTTIMKDKIQQADIEAEKKYPGAAIDRADGEKVSDAAVDDRVKVENNNPRNED